MSNRIDGALRCAWAASCIGLLAALTGCEPSTLRTEIYTAFGPGMKLDDPGTTYDWSPAVHSSARQVESEAPYVHEAIVRAINTTLAQKGFERRDVPPPDFWVNYDIVRRDTAERKTFETFSEFTLGVNLIDVATDKLRYRGAARIRGEVDATPQQRLLTIEKAVQRLFEKYPSRQ
jgi:hypothetical protein